LGPVIGGSTFAGDASQLGTDDNMRK
jgi:hypothetical protein